MSDYVRDLLRMALGKNAAGRDNMIVPDEIMDTLSGDAAQEAVMKGKLLTEMRKQDGRDDTRFIGLDLMEMEATEVDSFLKKARGRLIRRSKTERAACCKRIGGVLQQMMGPAGGDWADAKAAHDRGEEDPIGEADGEGMRKGTQVHTGEWGRATGGRPDSGRINIKQMKVGKTKRRRAGKKQGEAGYAEYESTKAEEGVEEMCGAPHMKFLKKVKKAKKVEESADALFALIAEEFDLREHDHDCEFAAELRSQLSEQEKFIQKAIKKPGALRAYFGVAEGNDIPVGKARAKYEELQRKAEGEKKLSESDSRLFKRLNLFLKVLRPISQESVEEATVSANPMNQPQGKLMTAGAQQQAAAAKQPGTPAQPVVQPKPVAQQPVVQQKPQPQPAVQPNQPQTQTADVDTTGGDVVSETAKALVGFTEAVGYGRNPQKGDGYSYAHKDKGGKSSNEVGDLKPPTYRDPEEKEGDYNAAYNTELMRVKSGTDREAGTPVSIKTRGKDAGDPIGEDEVEAPEASVTAHALAGFMESVGKSSSPKPDTSKRSYNSGADTRPDNKKDFVKTGQEDAKGDFPFKKHRFDKDPGDEGIPGGATKEQLVRPKKS